MQHSWMTSQYSWMTSWSGATRKCATTLSLGKAGSVYSMLRKWWINTKSSTEAELVGMDDGMLLVIWTQNFIMAQGYKINDNVVYQDTNQSTMLLEKNGRASSGQRTRHIDIQYFFVTNQVKHSEMRIEYCPTGDMVADFFTKPLQGSLFRKRHYFEHSWPRFQCKRIDITGVCWESSKLCQCGTRYP